MNKPRTRTIDYAVNDHRSAASRAASARVLAVCDQPGARVLGLGGGPFRIHPSILNLNIAAYENVDIVGDAHCLPLPTATIDAVHCEAVFEHLRDPEIAAREMYRVMKRGALAFVCTPFMQPFHGYPSHFQNFTLYGHRRLFERVGFDLLDSGTCVGPAWALAHVVSAFIGQYSPRLLAWPARATWWAVSRLFIRPLDRWLAERGDAYVIASTTFVLVRKP
jgi:SAM-dependent methyltransferase